jgi:hypothetical protein
MRLMLATLALATGLAAPAQAQTPSPQAPPEQVVITPATEPRDGNWPFEDEAAAPAPRPEAAAPEVEPTPAAPRGSAPRATAPAPTVTTRSTVPDRAAAPVGASPPAAAAAPTRRPDPSARAARRDGVATERAEAMHRTAAAGSRFLADIVAVEGRAEDATSTAIAKAAGAGPLESEAPIVEPVAARPASAQGPAAPAGHTDVTPLLLAIPLLFGVAVLVQKRGGVLRGRIRALVRRRAQTA